MAATLIGTAFLNATVQTLVDKLASSEFRDYLKNTKLNVPLLEQLQITLSTLKAVLNDAEEKQIKNSDVKQWLDGLKDAVLDAEDLLEEIAYDSLRCKVEKTHGVSKTKQVLDFFSSSPLKSFYAEINSQMKMLYEKLEHFAQHINILDLKTRSEGVSRRTPSSSVVNESAMVGREDDQKNLLNMLLSKEDTSSNVGVLAIWGMGGLGKTALAQLLYNNKEVQDHFPTRAWACVSEDFDILSVTKALLESATSTTCESNNPDILRVELRKIAMEKRFLFVLDDLWNEKYNDWQELVSPFIDGKSGSMVIITTRNRKVAEAANTFPIHELEPLSDEDCWSLLSKHAFGSDHFHGSKYANLEPIGRKIARKCGGLPIAAKTLGGLLRSKVDLTEWTEILNSDIWNLSHDNILPALRLSYQYLPSHLKRCFAYCAIFPKDHIFDRKHVVLLWMAEGFLDHSQGEKEAEKVGNDCFDELLSRSLIQKSNGNVRSEKFVMHDLVNDLATIISGKSCVRLECGGNVSKNVRYLSYNLEYYDIFKKFENLCDSKCLRSFLSVRSAIWFQGCLSRKVVNELLPILKRLRVLSLSRYQNITMLPDSIGSLVHLRYLDASWSGIKSLPDTICNLYNLQTLILSNCRHLTKLPLNIGKLTSLRHLDIRRTNIEELPINIGKLISLRHLDISDTQIQELPDSTCNLYNLQTLILSKCRKLAKLPISIEKLTSLRHLYISDTNIEELPIGIVELENLRTLTIFVVGRRKISLSIQELKRLTHLQGKFTILNLQNITNAKEASDANLKSIEQIEELVLRWSTETDNSQLEKDVLDALQPSVKLKKLSIDLYGGTSFPRWLGDSSFSSMVSLEIYNCNNCFALPPLGQLVSLKSLHIDGMALLDKIGLEFYGMEEGGSNSSFQPFPSLQNLTFKDMPYWKEWLPFEGNKSPFPELITLSLFNCPQLRGNLPNHLSSIEKLSIKCCDHLLATPPPALHWLSSIKEIDIEGGNGFEETSGRNQLSLLESDSICLLENVSISCCHTLFSIPKMILSSSCLQHLKLSKIPSLTAFPDSGLPTSLLSLEIQECENLSFLPPETWKNYKSLVTLKLWKCCNTLTSFPLDGFPALEWLEILGCGSLESIFISESCSSLSPSTLQSLYVRGCKSLRSLPQMMDTFTALESIILDSCPALRSLPQRMDTLTALEFLNLNYLPELELSFSEGTGLPSRLRVIYIASVGRMPVTKWGLERLTALCDLSITGVDIVETSLMEWLLPTSLVNLLISDLYELKSIEGSGLRHFTSLETLGFL